MSEPCRPALGQFILCYVSDEGRCLTPQGEGKSFDYAAELLREYRQNVPHKNWKMYKLVEVDPDERIC